MANEAITLPDLFTRVMDVCPAMRHSTPVHIDGLGWGIHGRRIDDSMAESLILAACVRWLVDNGKLPQFDLGENCGLYGAAVFKGYEDIEHYPQHKSLTIAALLAVEAVCKERRK